MAGTGHNYEIANVSEVQAFLSDASSDLIDGHGKEWDILITELETMANSAQKKSMQNIALQPNKFPYLLF